MFIGVSTGMEEEVLMGKLNMLPHYSLTVHEKTHKKL